MNPLYLLLGLGSLLSVAGLLALRGAPSSSLMLKGDLDVECTSQKQCDTANQMVRMLSRAVRAGYIGQEVLEFLVAKAYTESRWSWRAGTNAYNNAARGILGLRPESAWDRGLEDISPQMVSAMKDPGWALATALDYLWRIGPYVEGPRVTAMNAACAWAFPFLGKSVQLCRAQRPELFDRWAKALSMAGLPADFGKTPLRMNYPGIQEMYRTLTND